MILGLRETTKDHLNILTLLLVTGTITLQTSALIDDALHQATNTRKRARIENMTARTIRNHMEKIAMNQKTME